MNEKPEYEVLFYEKADGTCLIDDFLESLEVREKAKLFKWIQQLEQEGPHLPRPYADIIRGKIRELRLKFGHRQYRFLYFFAGRKIIMTHGFLKKTNEIPEEEICRAFSFMNDFLNRLKQGEIEL